MSWGQSGATPPSEPPNPAGITPGFLSGAPEFRLLAPAPDGEERWELLTEVDYLSAVLRGRLRIAPGFVSDFASVPRLPLAYWLFGGRARRAALPHDFLYQTHLTDLIVVDGKPLADALFREIMLLVGDGWAVRSFMWLGVHLGGQSAWESGPARFTRLGNVLPASPCFLPLPAPDLAG